MKMFILKRFSGFLHLSLLLSGLILAPLPVSAQYAPTREPAGSSSRRTGLVITEIMYHPRPVPGSTNRLQFIEIFNSKAWDEDISGFAIGGTVAYQFPSNTVLKAGSYLVLARDPGFLTTTYGVTNVVGPWNSALAVGLSINQGVVQLSSRQGALLLNINYSDTAPWPIAADGNGHSIVLAFPSFGEDDARAWAQSDVIGGSPGGPDLPGVEPVASVLINEWLAHTDTPLRDYLELYNHSNDPVDLSGAYLTDTADTNKFRIPNGTIIPPRGFLFYDDSVLGFSLLSEGETVYFVNSNQTRVIDVISFKGQSNAVASGRWPDGGPLHYGLAARTPQAANSVPKRYAVVINELMYNPISGNIDDEYVEIYNRSAVPANISGWAFTNGINFTFPNNTLMPAGAYWVVARNPANLTNIYSNLTTNNTFGPYTGTLANGGERVTLAAADYGNFLVSNMVVQLKLNVTASEVIYGDGGRWGNWSDGNGSSLELIDPEADTYLAANWADSDDTSESLWTAIEWSGPLGETLGTVVNDSVILMMQGVGECLLDEVEVRVDNGPNLVANGGFESDLTGWSVQGSHDLSTIETNGFAGAKCLHIRAGSRGDNQSNRILSAPFTAPIPSGATNVSIRAKARWLRGHPEVLVRLHGGGAEAYGMLGLPRRLGTPGAANSRRVANAGPGIFEVQHAPFLPAADQAVVVTARAGDPQGVAALTVRYRLDPSPAFLDLAMADDGTGGDAIANDGIYSATMPGQAAGTMVAFYVLGRDGSGATNTFPKDVFPPPGLSRCWPNDAVTRECVVRWGEVQMPGDFATFHLWVTSANSNRWHTRDAMNNAPMDGTFVYNDTRLVYNALPLYSGSPWHRTNSTTGPAGPHRVDYEMNFPDDDPMLGATDFILANPGNADILTISDLTALAEQTVYRVMEGMDLIQNHRRYLHLFVNGSQRSSTTQRPGNFIFEDVQQPNGDMIDQWFPTAAGGQLFKVEDWFEFENNGFDIAANNDADLVRRTVTMAGVPTLRATPYRFMFRKRSIGIGASANDYSQIFDLINAVSPEDDPHSATIDPERFGAVADWEEWMRVFAVQRAVGNWDSYGWMRGKNDYLYRPPGGLFTHMTWDMDYSLGLGRPANEPLFESNDPRVSAMFNTPAIVRAYWRAFEELVNGPFQNAVLDPFIDTRAAVLLANNVNIDVDAVASIKAYIAERRTFLQEQLLTVTTTFAIDLPSGFSTNDNLIEIRGTAPIGVKTITLNGGTYPVTWTSATSFVARVVLGAGSNQLNFQGVDRFNAPIETAAQSITIEYTGPVVDPIGNLIISEIMFNPSVAGGQFVEILNLADFNFDLSGWRIDGVGFVFPPGSIVTRQRVLVLAQDPTVFNATYGPVPVFGVFATSLSTLGHRLALIRPDPAGDTIIDAVRYETAAPWPGRPQGASLQLVDATQDNTRPSNWAFDLVELATPGEPNSVAVVLPPYDPVWLNEVQIESFVGPLDNFDEPAPWLEVYNAGPLPVSLDDYYLATNYTGNLLQFPLPPGISIDPGEHKILWADGQPGQTAGTHFHLPFRLDYSGQLALVRLVDGQPQITDYLTWEQPYANLSYGDFPDGQPVDRFTLHTPTPGAANFRRPVNLIINEWLARNAIGLRDPADDDANDYFEIYNAEPQPIDLGGYYLSDDPGNPTKYLVPSTGRYLIPPGGHLLVWADGETNQNRGDRIDLHVNFELPGEGGHISLYAPDGLLALDAITYGAQTDDISEGLYFDGSSARYFMSKPTPRAINTLTNINTPPSFPPIAGFSVLPNTTNTWNIRAADPDSSQILAYSIVSAPFDSRINQSGLYRWVVPADQAPGDYLHVVRVTDNGTPPRFDTLTIPITVRDPDAPVVVVTDPPPVFLAAASPDGKFTLTVETIAGHTYRVFYKNDLSDANWTLLDKEFVAANTTASLTDHANVPRRFYLVLRVN